MSTLPTSIVRCGEPSRSALAVASLRAVHQLLDEPLVLPDPVALPLLGAPTEAALRNDPFALNDPLSRGLRAALVVRSRFVEDDLSRRVAAGTRQYVLLGAGLDTFAYRNPHAEAGLKVFEVDHAGTQRWKRELLTEARIDVPPSLAFVSVDFERDDLLGALLQAGFQADRPACVSWMGVTMYLSPDTVLRTAAMVAGFAAGSCLCFDYIVPAAMLDPIERATQEFLAQRLAASGEPWLSTFEPARLQAQLVEAGFSSAESAAPGELNTRYFARRKDGLHAGGGVRILRAIK